MSTTNNTVKLKVLDREKGLAKKKSVFIVEYGGKQHKVPMFEFQEKEPNPDMIDCNIDDGVITQNVHTLYERFYPDLNKPYLFRVKQKRDTLKYYELIDPRIEKDDRKQRLAFNESSTELEIGQLITCRVKSIGITQLHLHLLDKKPSLVEYYEMGAIFNADNRESIKEWLDELLAQSFVADIKQMYDEHNSKWVFYFAKKIEKVAYEVLSGRTDKEAFLLDFSRGWLNLIEHSSFISKMSDEERKSHGDDLDKSIEICEDFIDALNVPDKGGRANDYIASLDPEFYQFRMDRRLRFMACSFSLDIQLLETNIQALLDKLKDMGENTCCTGSVSVSITHILKLYVNHISSQTENALSHDGKGSQSIKNCVRALCYLTRIMYKCNHEDVALYTSLLYQMQSLYGNQKKEEKLKLLRNSYNSLFINRCPLTNYRWEMFDSIVSDESYLLSKDDVPSDKTLRLIYSDGNTKVEATSHNFAIAPLNTFPSEMTSLKLHDGFTAVLCYGKSLSKLSQEVDFGNIQNIWSMVEKSVFAQARVIQEQEKKLTEGKDMDVYITEIVDELTARCKAVDYDVEGEIKFNDLFFYNKPGLRIDSLNGSDGSPLLFPAIYHNEDGKVTFSAEQFKKKYANEVMPRSLVTCYVISKRLNSFVAITADGFFVNFYSDNEEVQTKTFVDVYINNIKPNGYAEAELDGLSKNIFDNSKSYINFLRGMNNFYYENGATVASWNDSSNESEKQEREVGTRSVSEKYVKTLANIISKMSNIEMEPRSRYGYLFISSMLSKLIKNEEDINLYAIRMRYAKMLYDFSINNRLIDSNVEQFTNEYSDNGDIREVQEMRNVIMILGRYGKMTMQNALDKTLVGILTENATPLEKELSRLVLSANLLTRFNNKAIDDHILGEMGNTLNINIAKREPFNIGLEEGQTVEFKTSIVYPPTGDGIEEVNLQSENIAREISAMMNAEGGTLYIGINDYGNVVGLQSDLEYFASGNVYEEVKAKDKFRNHFSCLLTDKFGALAASKFTFDFEDKNGYLIFKVNIPKLPGQGGDYIRVGTTCQKK